MEDEANLNFKDISIVIKTSFGKSYKLSVNPRNTILDIKHKIENSLGKGLHVEQQNLIFGGKNLNDEYTLNHYNIRNESILLWVLSSYCKCDNPPQTIYLKKLSGAKIAVTDVDETDTIYDLKKKIENQYGYPIQDQTLLFKAQKLLNDNTVMDYKIQDNTIIHLLFFKKNQEKMITDDDEIKNNTTNNINNSNNNPNTSSSSLKNTNIVSPTKINGTRTNNNYPNNINNNNSNNNNNRNKTNNGTSNHMTPKTQSQTTMKPKPKPKRQHLFPPKLTYELMKSNKLFYAGCGLRNLGNSCFMNSVLQCLCYTAPLQNYFNLNKHSKRYSSSINFMDELSELLPKMAISSSLVIKPQKLYNNLRSLSRTLNPGRQEDCHEFWSSLMKRCQDEVIRNHFKHVKGNKIRINVDLSETTIIYKIWGGSLKSQVKCMECFYESNTYDSTLDLSLELNNKILSVVDALKEYTNKEKLYGTNKYFCERCNKKSNATKQLTINESPNILVLHLKRFEFGTKIDRYIKYQKYIDFTPYMSYFDKIRHKNSLYKKYQVTYTLFGIIVHAGVTSNSGHYYSYIKTNDNRWYEMNDSNVRHVSENHAMSQNAYMLFYQINQIKMYQ